MQSSIKIARIDGIDVGIHYTWLIAVALITWSLAAGFFPATYPGQDPSTYWLLGIAGAVLLFVSVLIHELSHSLVATARGLKVNSITLFIFGGVSNIAGESTSPRDEFLISIVGPLSSLALAAIFYLVGPGLTPGTTATDALLFYLTSVNLSLGLFNLVPGFPLDGGRVLRSIVWAITGSLRRATEVASYVGQAVGFLLIAMGVFRFFGGDAFGGLWIAFIGWFLNSAAESTRRQQVLTENLRGIRVAQLMNPSPPVASPSSSVQDFVFEHVTGRGERALPVLDHGRLVGLVSISDARKLPQEQWAETPVAAIMTPMPLKTTTPDADVKVALQTLVEGDLNQLPVLQQGQLVGMLSRADVLRFLQLHTAPELRGAPRAGTQEAAARLPSKAA